MPAPLSLSIGSRVVGLTDDAVHSTRTMSPLDIWIEPSLVHLFSLWARALHSTWPPKVRGVVWIVGGKNVWQAECVTHNTRPLWAFDGFLSSSNVSSLFPLKLGQWDYTKLQKTKPLSRHQQQNMQLSNRLTSGLLQDSGRLCRLPSAESIHYTTRKRKEKQNRWRWPILYDANYSYHYCDQEKASKYES